MGSHLDKYLLPRFGSLPIPAIDERRVQEFIADLTRMEYMWPNGVSRKLSPKTIRNVVGVQAETVARMEVVVARDSGQRVTVLHPGRNASGRECGERTMESSVCYAR